MKSHERCCWKKEEAWTSDLLFSHLWWDLLFLESLFLTDQFESKGNQCIYQIHSLPDSLVCICRSITRSHWCGELLLCLSQVAMMISCHHKWKFSSAGCNLVSLAGQGTGTEELTPFIKQPCSKSHGNFIPSGPVLSERKETQGSSAEV